MVKLLAFALLAAIASCRSSGTWIDWRIKQADQKVCDAGNAVYSKDYDKAIAYCDEVIPSMKESDYISEQMRYYAATVRAQANVIRGRAAFLKELDKRGWTTAAQMKLVGSPEGGSPYFEAALADMEASEKLPHSYVPFYDPYTIRADALTYLGRYSEAESEHEMSVKWALDYPERPSYARVAYQSKAAFHVLMWTKLAYEGATENKNAIRIHLLSASKCYDDVIQYVEDQKAKDAFAALSREYAQEAKDYE